MSCLSLTPSGKEKLGRVSEKETEGRGEGGQVRSKVTQPVSSHGLLSPEREFHALSTRCVMPPLSPVRVSFSGSLPKVVALSNVRGGGYENRTF